MYHLLKNNSNIKITLYEKNTIGGHSYTFDIDEKDKVDIGFQVFNKITYPNITKFFSDLEIPIQKSNMSFSVITNFINWGTGTIFSLIYSLFSFSFLVLLYNMWYFHHDANLFVEKPDYELTIEEYCIKYKYNQKFVDGYLLPFCSAVWSVSEQESKKFIAYPILKFMKNHGLLQFKKVQWYTLSNRSRSYIDKILKKYKNRINIITRSPYSIKKNYVDNIFYDHIIFGVHGDQILSLLDNPNDQQKDILSKFKYTLSNCYIKIKDL